MDTTRQNTVNVLTMIVLLAGQMSGCTNTVMHENTGGYLYRDDATIAAGRPTLYSDPVNRQPDGEMQECMEVDTTSPGIFVVNGTRCGHAARLILIVPGVKHVRNNFILM